MTIDVLVGLEVTSFVICGALFATVTATDPEGVMLPPASNARTVSAYVPSFTAVVFQFTLQAPEVIAGPRLAPLS